ncbi:MAG TPA: SDR family NAD(P)-dependent oxidoreductase [Micromonosporaceae bacterium]|nr:SDR family NAD(P)-dependent oxidoreductase [Micromonosporaceae bacterium]
MPLTKSLDESVVVVTGASGGIGAATALALAGRGASVVLAGRREDALEDVAQACVDEGGRALVVPTDTTVPVEVERLAGRAAGEFGRLDAWVNNAAAALYAPLRSAPMAEIRQTVEVGLFGYLYGARAALPWFDRAGGGVLVNVASVLGVVSAPYLSAYTITKHGVVALSDTLRQELRAEGDESVSVCTVLPGSIDTPFYRHAGNHTGRAVQPVPPVYPPERVARRIVRLLEHPRREVYVGTATRLLAAQWRLSPGLTERALGWYAGRMAFVDTPTRQTSGNLFTPSADDAAVAGGFEGARRATIRRAAAIAAGGVAAMALARRLAR